MSITIEEGKFYRNREGDTVGPIETHDRSGNQWVFTIGDGARLFDREGRAFGGYELNLVEEAPNPAIEADGFITRDTPDWAAQVEAEAAEEHGGIKEGPFYRTRDGRRVGPLKWVATRYLVEDGYGYWTDGAGHSWFKNGKAEGGVNSTKECPDDIVGEWVSEAEYVTIEPTIRTFSTGASRDQDASKFDFEGFLSPLALNAFAAYMHKNRTMADGSLRDSDNWQKGIPTDAYMKSMWRHFFDVWAHHRGAPITKETMNEALCGLLFNAMGYLHETQKNVVAD